MPTDLKPKKNTEPKEFRPLEKGELVGKKLLYAAKAWSFARGSHIKLNMSTVVSTPIYVAYVLSLLCLTLSCSEWVKYWTFPESDNFFVGFVIVLLVYCCIRKIADAITGTPITESFALSIATASDMFAAFVDPGVDAMERIELDENGRRKS